MNAAIFGFVGDVFIDRDDPIDVFRHVRDVMATPDMLFGNLEGVYTDHPEPVPSAISPLSAARHNLTAYAPAGFDVMSMANNHAVDVGYRALLETRDQLRGDGIATCGAGVDIADARTPALLEKGGVRVAVLAYSSTFPIGYEARKGRPGLAPMRAYNFWREPYPNHAPGRIPMITTVPDEADVADFRADIAGARKSAEIVIASFHWGDHTRAFHLTDHEKRTARLAIDEGADIVVGHHGLLPV